MAEVMDDYSKSGSKLEEVEGLKPRVEQGVPTISWPAVKALTKSLFRGTGALKGLGLLIRSNTWDMIANKPEWHPEYFEFSDEEEEEMFKKVFDVLTPTIILYDNLKRRYGEYLADEITANMAIPIQLAFYPKLFPFPEDRADIDQWRQAGADAFSNKKAYECREWVSEDRTEYHMRWTKCAPMMILRAYGMHSYAGNTCLADHVVFDCLVPEVIFSRAHTIGLGDSYCDHVMRLPLSEDDKKEEADYADCDKVKFGGRSAVEHWKEVYKRYGKFRF
jgi:hypothetical protein